MKLHVIGKQQMQHQKTGLWYDGYICTDGINTQIIPEQKLIEYAEDHRTANARVVSFRGRKVLQITSKLDNKLPIQTEVMHTVKTKSKEYIICGPVDRLPNGNKCLTVNIMKGLELEKRVIVEDDGTQPVPWGTGLGKAPIDLWESLDTIFCNY